MPHPGAGQDSNLRLTVQRFSGPSCQKAINISFGHFGSGVERKEGVLKSVLYNFQRYFLFSFVIEKILENELLLSRYGLETARKQLVLEHPLITLLGN